MARQLTAEEYDQGWRSAHELVFSGRAADERPFVSREWAMFLIGGGLRPTDADLDLLHSFAAAVGDEILAVVDGGGHWGEEPPQTIRLTREDLEEIRCGTVYGHTTAHLFGLSAQWGLVTHQEGFGVLGCTPSLAMEFERLAGGAEEIRRRYEEVASGIGFGDAGRQYRARLEDMVGWGS